MGISSITNQSIYQPYNTSKLAKPQATESFATLLVAASAPSTNAANNAVPAAEKSNAKVMVSTNKGDIAIDIDDYFSPKSNITFDGINAVPLLLPNAQTINALSRHASEKLQRLLADNHIPSGPAKINYDQEGKMQLPADYAYADAFKAMLTKNSAMERELSTINGLSSTFSSLQESSAFSTEYAAATTRAQAEAVVAKYSYLFNNSSRHHAQIALEFSADGTLQPTADGKPYNVASN